MKKDIERINVLIDDISKYALTEVEIEDDLLMTQHSVNNLKQCYISKKVKLKKPLLLLGPINGKKKSSRKKKTGSAKLIDKPYWLQRRYTLS